MISSIRKHAAAIVAGITLALCFPTWHLYPLAWGALIPLLYGVRGFAPREAARHFFVAGLFYYLVLLQWLMSNIYWAGGWAIWGYVLLCAFMAGYWGLTGYLWSRIRDRWPALSPLSLALLWTAMEYLQAILFTGFGWGALGYSQGSDLALLQWAAIGGVSIISFLLVLVNGLLLQALIPGGRRVVPVATAAIVLAGAHGVGYAMLGSPQTGERPFTAGIVQSNFSLEMKWDWEYVDEMARNAAEKSRWLAHHQKVDLLVWPESTLVDTIERPGIHAIVTGLCQETATPLFTGAVRFGPENAELNSSYLIDANGQIVTHYDKIHLAPFGEYVPLSKLLPFVQQVVPSIGDVASGDEPKVLHCGERAFGPLICFETLFAPMSERMRAMGADMLVVITNLSWFGVSNAIPEELEIARMRAVETRLPLIHSSNSGISGVFDPWGRFTGIDNAFDERGNVVSYQGRIAQDDTIRRRLFGAVTVPLPAQRPLSAIPAAAFSWLALAASGLLAAVACLPRRNARANSR